MGTLFERENLMWMLIGIVVMTIGFILMAGGKSNDPNIFNKEEVYSPRRITVAPIVVLAGLVVLVLGIFRNSRKTTTEA
jgi:hypothetical protein